MAKKSVEDKIPIKQFRDSSSNWWVRDAHYYLNEKNELLWAAGETDKEKLLKLLLRGIKKYIEKDKRVL